MSVYSKRAKLLDIIMDIYTQNGVQSEILINETINTYVRRNKDPITLYVKKENNCLIFENLDELQPKKEDLPIKIRKFARRFKRRREEDEKNVPGPSKKIWKPDITYTSGQVHFKGRVFHCKIMQSLTFMYAQKAILETQCTLQQL